MKNYTYLFIILISFLYICLVCKGCINIYERLTISGNGDEKCNNINISQNITLNNVCNCKSNENICPQKNPIKYCRQYNNIQDLDIHFHHVFGHTKNNDKHSIGNDRADNLARKSVYEHLNQQRKIINEEL